MFSLHVDVVVLALTPQASTSLPAGFLLWKEARERESCRRYVVREKRQDWRRFACSRSVGAVAGRLTVWVNGDDVLDHEKVGDEWAGVVLCVNRAG